MNPTINSTELACRIVVSVLLFGPLLIFGCSSSRAGQSNTPPAAVDDSDPAQAPAPAGANLAPSAQPMPVSPAAATGPAPSQEHLAGIGSATIITIHGKIVSVNRAKKLATLEGPHGKTVTLHVRNPHNLKAAKPGSPLLRGSMES